MIVIGGTGSKEEFLNDTVAYNLTAFEWMDCTSFIKTTPFKSGIAYHKIVSVYEDKS